MRPFQRVSKHFLAPNSLIFPKSSLPTPPPDGASDGADAAQKQHDAFQQLREDIILDFSTYEASLVHTQFTLDTNERERNRYALDKDKLLADAQTIRDSIADLRLQLDEAQKTLAIRKTWDDLATKITGNKALKPRDEQHAELVRLESDIAELEEEGEELERTRNDRKEQFHGVMVGARAMLRHIKGEPEEPEQDGDEHDESMEDIDGRTPREGVSRSGTPSHMGTPRPEGSATPLHVSQETGGATPMLTAHKDRLVPLSPGRNNSSRATSPGLGAAVKKDVDPTQDIDMTDQHATSDLPHVSVDVTAPESDLEEGEAEEGAVEEDRMEVS